MSQASFQPLYFLSIVSCDDHIIYIYDQACDFVVPPFQEHGMIQIALLETILAHDFFESPKPDSW